MILFTVGMSEFPFDRLLDTVDALPAKLGPVVVQGGPSRIRSKRAVWHAYLSYEELLEHINHATAVVTHAGLGSVALTLSARKRPIAVPRLKCFGEAVDNHQVDFGRRLARIGVIDLVEDPAGLWPMIQMSTVAERNDTPVPRVVPGALAREVQRLIETWIGPGSRVKEVAL